MKQFKNYQIILADDDEDDIFLFREALAQISVDTSLEIAENGMVLINMLEEKTEAPDIIFLDMNMPIKNGLECLVEIRNSPIFKDTPVVILSTSTQQYLLESTFDAGANYYIQKPNSFASLVEIIQKSLFAQTNSSDLQSMEQFFIRTTNNQPDQN